MRSIFVPLFYLWLFGSLGVLVHRRFTTGTFRPTPKADGVATESPTAARFPPPPPDPTGAPMGDGREPAPGTVAVEEPAPTSATPAESLAEALEGITMPCDLTPLIAGELDPHAITFTTRNHEPATVGTALADEFERLGYALTPIDDRTIDATRNGDRVVIKLTSAGLDSPAVMAQRFPTATDDALVVELELR